MDALPRVEGKECALESTKKCFAGVFSFLITDHEYILVLRNLREQQNASFRRRNLLIGVRLDSPLRFSGWYRALAIHAKLSTGEKGGKKLIPWWRRSDESICFFTGQVVQTWNEIEGERGAGVGEGWNEARGEERPG